jgi:hypothetical protein
MTKTSPLSVALLILSAVALISVGCGGGGGGSTSQQPESVSTAIQPGSLYASKESDLFSIVELGSGDTVYALEPQTLTVNVSGGYTVNLREDRSYLLSIERNGVGFASTVISGNQIQTHLSEETKSSTSFTPTLNLGEINAITTLLALQLQDELSDVDKANTDTMLESFLEKKFSSSQFSSSQFSSSQINSFADIRSTMMEQTKPELAEEQLGRVNMMVIAQEILDDWSGGTDAEQDALGQLLSLLALSSSADEVWDQFRDKNLGSFLSSVTPANFMESFAEGQNLFFVNQFSQTQLQDLYWPESTDSVPSYVSSAIGQTIVTYTYSGNLQTMLVSGADSIESYSLVVYDDSGEAMQSNVDLSFFSQGSSGTSLYSFSIENLTEGSYSANLEYESLVVSGYPFSVPEILSASSLSYVGIIDLSLVDSSDLEQYTAYLRTGGNVVATSTLFPTGSISDPIVIFNGLSAGEYQMTIEQFGNTLLANNIVVDSDSGTLLKP